MTMSHLLRLGAVLFAFFASAPALAALPAHAPDFSICAKPVWPKAALRAEQTGTVTLEFRVGADGKVLESRIRKSSGFALLDEAARDGIQRCTFASSALRGASGTWYPMQYVWSLEGPPAKPPAPPPPLFERAPPALRAFLLEAKQADAIADPLQRCLTFPDLPGNKWAPGLTRGYCELLLGEVITLKTVAQHLERGTLAELEALYRRDFERHFSKQDFSEIIHRDLQSFDRGAEAARLTAAWVEKAPNSPFAQLFRAAHLSDLAHEARGGAWAKDTPAEKMARMSALVGQANEAYGKAIRLEPRLLPAYIGVMYTARLDSLEIGEAAFARADAVDPACRYLSRERMSGLTPRWGGSQEDMDAYAKALEPLVAARPLVALSLIIPPLTLASDAEGDDKNAQVIKALEPAALVAPHPDMLAELGVARYYADADLWQTLAYLVTAYRYDNDNFKAARARGGLLLKAGDPAWALKAIERAAVLEPNDLYTAYLAGLAHQGLEQYAQAEPFLLKALALESSHEDVLYHLAEGALRAKQLEKADAHSALYVRTYPASLRGWFQRYYIKYMQGDDPQAVAALTSLLKIADRRDPHQAESIAFAERRIKKLSEPAKAE